MQKICLSKQKLNPVNYIPFSCIRFLSHATFNSTLSSIFVYLVASLQDLFFKTVKNSTLSLQ